MNPHENQIGMIETIDLDGGGAFILLRQFNDRIVVAVSQEKNGDAELPLTVDECEAMIQMLRRGIDQIMTSK